MELITNPLVDIRSPFLSRDGELLYYAAANLESDIWMLELVSAKLALVGVVHFNVLEIGTI